MTPKPVVLEVNTGAPKPLLFDNLPTWAQQRATPAESGCWLWSGSLRRGYGRIKSERRAYGAHRAVYEAMIGAIPEGLELDHLCRVRHCVNPAHLEPVTRQVNHLRGLGRFNSQGRTHCKRGHSLEDAYILGGPSRAAKGYTSRSCRPCAKEGSARRYREQRDSRIV